jgi:hypothetical protein
MMIFKGDPSSVHIHLQQLTVAIPSIYHYVMMHLLYYDTSIGHIASFYVSVQHPPLVSRLIHDQFYSNHQITDILIVVIIMLSLHLLLHITLLLVSAMLSNRIGYCSYHIINCTWAYCCQTTLYCCSITILSSIL